MKYYSTNKQSADVNLRDAILRGLAPDGGLYMPEYIPRLDPNFIERIHLTTMSEVAFAIANSFFGEDIPINDLHEIIAKAMTFNAPLIKLSDQLFSLELFHGPTLSFKDFGMSFMARLVAFLIKNDTKEINVLAATSGDTGSAVGHGFLKVPGVRVWILYPKGQVSHTQEQQLTTFGNNITTIEVAGSFDDCQRLVKEAFNDRDLQRKKWLTSANSINIGRLIPQIFYYFFGYNQLNNSGKDVVFSVPSGNFGNLTAGLIAKKMGLPIKRMIAATNSNDSVPMFLKTGSFSPKPSIKTISNAMDVGNPSNFARILDLYDNDHESICKDVFGCSYSDEETAAAVQEMYNEFSYIADPHGAIGYLGMRDYLKEQPGSTGIILETAHPAKFQDVVEPILHRSLDIPEILSEVLKKEKIVTSISNDFKVFKDILLQ